MKLLIIILCSILGTSIVWGTSKVSRNNELSTNTPTKNNPTIQKTNTIHPFTINDINGNKFKFNQFAGSVILLVNTASKCGFTNQYEGLESLYNTYKNQSFTVIGIPSNNFGNQEPGTNESIKKFCTLNYNVTFPMMAIMA
jgi:glutathione peroxidase